MKRNKSIADKPYNRCLTCHHRIEKRCDGPRTSAMELPRWCEFMRAMKEANDLTNAEVAERSGVSIKTIERLMAMNCDQDIMRETARRIEDAIIGSSNQYPCYLAYDENVPQTSEQLANALLELERALADNADYRKALDDIHASYNAEMQHIRNDAQQKIDDLRSRLELLKQNNTFLWAENNRKSKVIDTILAEQSFVFSKKETGGA